MAPILDNQQKLKIAKVDVEASNSQQSPNYKDINAAIGKSIKSSGRYGEYDRIQKFEEGLDFMSKLQNAAGHMEDQRRRLEHFLAVAKMARAFQDIAKIKDLLNELHMIGKPLPYSRINELKALDVMTSPYN